MNYQTLVGYLERAEPAEIANLRRSFPGAAHLFSSAMQLGDAANQTTVPAKHATLLNFDRPAGLALLAATSSQLARDIDDIIAAMKRRMHLVHNIRFGSEIVTTVSGAVGATLAVLARSGSWSNDTIALGTALTTMAAGLLALFSNHFERTPAGVKFAGVEELTALVELRTEIEKFSMRVKQDVLLPLSEEEMVAATKAMNDMALKVLRLKYLNSK